jgi:hypothetical protein
MLETWKIMESLDLHYLHRPPGQGRYPYYDFCSQALTFSCAGDMKAMKNGGVCMGGLFGPEVGGFEESLNV